MVNDNKATDIYLNYLPETGEVIISLPNGWQRRILSMDDDEFMRCALHYLIDPAPCVFQSDFYDRFANLVQSKLEKRFSDLSSSTLAYLIDDIFTIFCDYTKTSKK